MKERRAIREGLLSGLDADSRLLGTQCNGCAQVFFPGLQDLCYKCLSEDFTEVELSAEGTLYSYTTCMIPAKGFTPPYVNGYVELPEGIRVFCPMEEGGSAENLEIGMPVKISVAPVRETDEEEVIGYRFSPL